MSVSMSPPAWYADPSGRYELRYWDGRGWSAHVAAGGRQFVDVPAGSVSGGVDLMPAMTSHPYRPPDPATKWLLPVGRSGWAIAAGYAGLFALVVFPAPIALALGIVALVDLHRRPGLMGRGRAIFGLTVGAVGTLLVLAIVLSRA